MVNKDYLASAVCTILDWQIVIVAGMWILHPVDAIHLAQGIINITGMKSQRRSFSNACNNKESI